MKRVLISQSNSKLKKDHIATFNLPSVKTCPGAGACLAFCYDKKACAMYKAVNPARQRNLEASKGYTFHTLLSDEIHSLPAKWQRYFRLHSSGDVYSKGYFEKLKTVCTQNPFTQFYMYTKSVHLIKGTELPGNLRVIYSYGGKFDHMIDPAKDRHAKIFDTLEELLAAGYVNCSESDLVAATTPSLKLGLVKH